MIIVRLTGGLGNQMFQYAAARSVADRHGVRLELDITDYKHHKLRRYELGDFTIRAEIASKDDIESLGVDTTRLSLFGRFKRRLLPSSSNTVYRERSLSYDSGVESIVPPMYLDGYWQSERYFTLNEDVIRRDFSSAYPLNEPNSNILAQIQAVNAVSLHIRRGDYVSDLRTNRMHGICSLDYYRSAIDYISGKVTQPHFFIFSDDHSWVQRNFYFVSPSIFVTVNSSDMGVLDMILMQQCKHHIIANSSFSWWGAWLDPSSDKIVVAPKRWFNDLRFETKDLVPSSWVRL